MESVINCYIESIASVYSLVFCNSLCFPGLLGVANKCEHVPCLLQIVAYLLNVHNIECLCLYFVDGRHSSDSKDGMLEGHCCPCPPVLV